MIPLLSIALETIIALLALVAALRGRPYMAGFAVTFGIYVYYDLARHYAWEANEQMLSLMFLVATLAALASVISIVRTK